VNVGTAIHGRTMTNGYPSIMDSGMRWNDGNLAVNGRVASPEATL